ncbi:MAG: acetylglutamate kinase [Legionellales bacterium]|nr:acetylglutamate kinase [Legionellales bacterium]
MQFNIILNQDLKLLKGVGIHVILVHGGGKAIDQALAMHHINSHFVDGLRVTSNAAMDIIEMVLCGHINNMLVKQLNHIGIRAVGLTGADDHLLQCEPISTQHERAGKVKAVNIQPIINILHTPDSQVHPIPVIAPIGIDSQGQSLNVNADVAACEIAMALGVNKLIYLTDQDGIFDADGQRLSSLDTHQLQQLIDQQIVKEGMLTKVRAILTALQTNMNHIHIINGQRPHALIEELFTVAGIGSLCKSTLPGEPQPC